MATVDSPISGLGSAAVDPTRLALRASLSPIEYLNVQNNTTNAGGHYAMFGSSSALAFNGGVIAGNFRYTGTGVCIILRAFATVTVVTAVTAQRNDPLLLKQVRSYTVDDSTNGTLLTATGNNGKRRANMATCQATMRVAGNVAGMTGGTSTVDSNAIGAMAMGASALGALGTGMPTADLYKWDKSGGDYPLCLVQNEGLQLLSGATTIATGTIIIGWGVEWVEAPAF